MFYTHGVVVEVRSPCKGGGVLDLSFEIRLSMCTTHRPVPISKLLFWCHRFDAIHTRFSANLSSFFCDLPSTFGEVMPWIAPITLAVFGLIRSTLGINHQGRAGQARRHPKSQRCIRGCAQWVWWGECQHEFHLLFESLLLLVGVEPVSLGQYRSVRSLHEAHSVY